MLNYLYPCVPKNCINQFYIMSRRRPPSLVQPQIDDILFVDSDVSDLSDDSDHDYIFSEDGGDVPSPRKRPSVLETNHALSWLSSGSRKRSINHATVDGELQSAPPAKLGRGRGRPSHRSRSRGRGRGRARARGRWSGRDVVARLLQIHLTDASGNLLVISLLLSSTWMILMGIWVVILSQN